MYCIVYIISSNMELLFLFFSYFILFFIFNKNKHLCHYLLCNPNELKEEIERKNK